jgi:hypothetical protein
MKLFFLSILSLKVLVGSTTNDGVDVSFPMHHQFKDKSSVFAKRYLNSMAGCYAKYSKNECDATERARIAMNLEQPKKQHNYTESGFKKTRVPAEVWGDIQTFFAENKDKEKPESWPRGNTYVNSWESPSYMVSFEDGVRNAFNSFLFYFIILRLNG